MRRTVRRLKRSGIPPSIDELLGYAKLIDQGIAQLEWIQVACVGSFCRFQNPRIRVEQQSLGLSVSPDVKAIVEGTSRPRGFEPLEVTTTTGTVYSGVLRDDLPDTLVLTTATSEELRLPKSSVKDVQPSTVSLMPPGYGQQLTPAQLADLVTFLKRARWGAQ